MGKNKQKKTNSVFKVAGAKSLKSKAKAKAVTGQLKNLKKNTKNKIQEIDKQLVNLQDKVRQPKVESKKQAKTSDKPKPPKKDNHEEEQQKSTSVLDDLDEMQL